MGQGGFSLRASTRRSRVWRGGKPLILASKSDGRRALLTAAGLDIEVVHPSVDERDIERRHFARGGTLDGLARALAHAASELRPDAYCLGADQTLAMEGRVMHKPRDFADAALVVDDDHAELRMRPLDLNTIARYFDLAGPTALSSVGSYQVEGLGVH